VLLAHNGAQKSGQNKTASISLKSRLRCFENFISKKTRLFPWKKIKSKIDAMTVALMTISRATIGLKCLVVRGYNDTEHINITRLDSECRFA
jgi:hypothetical protein